VSLREGGPPDDWTPDGWALDGRCVHRIGEDLDAAPVSAPPALHLDHLLGEHLFLLHRQRAAHAVVMEGPGPTSVITSKRVRLPHAAQR